MKTKLLGIATILAGCGSVFLSLHYYSGYSQRELLWLSIIPNYKLVSGVIFGLAALFVGVQLLRFSKGTWVILSLVTDTLILFIGYYS
jgi:hypothetical protein